MSGVGQSNQSNTLQYTFCNSLIYNSSLSQIRHFFLQDAGRHQRSDAQDFPKIPRKLAENARILAENNGFCRKYSDSSQNTQI